MRFDLTSLSPGKPGGLSVTHHGARIRHLSGIALIIVMISIFVLAILAGAFAFSMKVETKLAQHADNQTELRWLGRSGVEYARWVLALQATCPLEPYDGLNQTWATGVASGPCATNGAMMEVQQEIHLGHPQTHQTGLGGPFELSRRKV